ncbi:MAG: MoxR family ATPase [Pseudomonadota bacterium]
MTLDDLRDRTDRLRTTIARAVQGQEAMTDLILTALIARGHVLLEGPPGTAKTLLARAFAAALSLGTKRIQFTPDLMPGDVLGSSIFDFSSNRFNLVKGPIFTDVLIADEINRAPPKTQAALLQAMSERKATIDGQDHLVGDNFIVIATQNPIEQQGTYPLPEAQLDRFLFKIFVDYPDEEIERSILRDHAAMSIEAAESVAEIEPTLDADALAEARALVDGIRIDDTILDFVLTIVRATRNEPEIAYGASTRAADALARAVRVTAALEGRDYALPDDVKRLALPVLRHRIVLGPTAEIEGRVADDALARLLDRIEAPR